MPSHRFSHNFSIYIESIDNKKMSAKGESAFFQYYKAQKVISDDEFEIWHKTLKTPLPITFRLSPLSNVKKLQSEMRSIEVRALTFLPDVRNFQSAFILTSLQ